MAIYNIDGESLSDFYDMAGNLLTAAYDIDGNLISGDVPVVDPYIFGTAHPVSEMTLTDASNVAAISLEHTRNGSSTIEYTPTLKGDSRIPVADYEWIYFSCNIKTNGENAGLWIYVPPESTPAWAGKSKKNNGLSYLRIKLNSNSYSWQEVHAGWEYYHISNPPDVITSIGVAAINRPNATDTSPLYIDSLEVGFHARKAHIMFNLDCVPVNFMDVGYPLFEQYGLKCTLHYPISSSDSTAGADSDYLIPSLHNQLLAEGYDFATYSGWQGYEFSESVPFYDDSTKQAQFEAHAERMWKVNNDSGIYAPSCIHSTGFLWGYVYNNACMDYDFLMIRRGSCSDASGYGLSSYYDPATRTMIPYFLQNAWTADASKISNIKTRIDAAVRTKQTIQIGFHQIKGNSYTPVSGDIYIGVDAVAELLEYVKAYVDSGDIVCCTTADYVKEMDPDTYAAWYAQRQHEA